MKTKITLLISAVALVTLSFTFANIDSPAPKTPEKVAATASEPIGGFMADDVVE